MKRMVKSGVEQDVVSRYWRRMYCYLKRAGVSSGIKRQIRRRERHDAKQETRSVGD